MTTTPPATATLRRLERASGALATKSVARMDETLPWFRAMPADQRSWVMLIAQAGIASFVEWLRSPGDAPRLTTEVFRAGPQELARSVSLQQAVELVRVTVEVVEGEVEGFGAPGEQAQLREAVLRYSREIAFAAAQVYAGVAELRGAWDARLEALVVDVLLRGDVDETLLSRASALGWAAMTPVAVVIGAAPKGHPEQVLDAVQRAARHAGVDVLAGVPGDRLVVVLGGVTDAMAGTRPLLPEFGAGPVVVGPTVADLGAAGTSARAALAGIRAVPGSRPETRAAPIAARAWPSMIAVPGRSRSASIAATPAARYAITSSTSGASAGSRPLSSIASSRSSRPTSRRSVSSTSGVPSASGGTAFSAPTCGSVPNA